MVVVPLTCTVDFFVAKPTMPQILKLIVAEGPYYGLHAVCRRGETLIVGRGSSADFTIMDLRLSRAHFQIEQEGDGWLLIDLESHNGTEVNGASVKGTKTLQAQDIIVAGDTRFTVSFDNQSWIANLTCLKKTSIGRKP